MYKALISVLQFHVLHFHVLLICPPFSCPAISCPSFSAPSDRMMHGRVISYCRFSKWRPSAILDFHLFAFFVKNSNLRLYLRRHAKFGEDRTTTTTTTTTSGTTTNNILTFITPCELESCGHVHMCVL